MKVSVLQKDLAKALSISSRFVSSRAQLPILANILLSAKKAKLLILATNLETSISTSVGAKVETQGEITVPARLISDIIANLSSETLQLTAKEEKLSIKTESFSGNLLGMNTSDFPSVPQSVGKADFNLPYKDLLNALSKVLFSVSSDDTRPFLTGVLFIFKKNNLLLVSSDGFRLSQKSLVLKKAGLDESLILPKTILAEIARIQPSSGNLMSFKINKKDNQVIFGLDTIVLTSRIIEGKFPDFEKIIPSSYAVKVLVDKTDLVQAVKLSSVIARDATNIIKFKVGEDNLEISAQNPKSGEQKSNIEAKVEGEQTEVSYNYRFIEEFLAVVAGDEVAIELTDATSPGVFRDTSDKNFFHIIMPVRVGE